MSRTLASLTPHAHHGIAGLRCLRCGALYQPDHFVADCPACRATAPSNLAVEYGGNVLEGITKQSLASGPRSIWRYAHSLPVAAEDGISLGEGLTPLVELSRLARQLNVGSLHAKCEFANPTGSFKDRLASVAVSAGRALFDARVIASSSSGNAGAAAAAYAARAGLPCIVFTFLGTAGPMVTQMQAYSAMVRCRRGQGPSLDAARSRRAQVRLVPNLAVLRPGRRQQPVRYRGVQVARLRNHGATRACLTGSSCRSATATH